MNEPKADTQIKILTLKEAAKLMKVSERSVRRWFQHGDLPAFRLGDHWRIKESDLVAHLENRLDLPTVRDEELAAKRRRREEL